jgi:hypothetical protein
MAMNMRDLVREKMEAADPESFKLKVSQFKDTVQQNANAILRKAVLALGRDVVMASPVGNPSLWARPYHSSGYVGGHFRGNWQFATGACPEGILDTIDPNGDATVAILRGQIEGFAFGQTGYLANNLPYSLRVEFGWSTQAPGGMVRIAVERWQDFLNTACEEVNPR